MMQVLNSAPLFHILYPPPDYQCLYSGDDLGRLSSCGGLAGDRTMVYTVQGWILSSTAGQGSAVPGREPHCRHKVHFTPETEICCCLFPAGRERWQPRQRSSGPRWASSTRPTSPCTPSWRTTGGSRCCGCVTGWSSQSSHYLKRLATALKPSTNQTGQPFVQTSVLQVADPLFDFFPGYLLGKCVFLVWCQAPSNHSGANMLFNQVGFVTRIN